jgi:uncharacterized repeat protein (TIGR01451 family)
VALIASGAVLATAVAAGADAPNATSNTGTAVNNHDGTVTVTVNGSWDWGTSCDTGGRIVGWGVDWNDPDQAGYPLGTTNPFGVDVGVAESGLNPVDPQATSVSVDPGNDPCPAEWGPLSHTYTIASVEEGGIAPCVVLYDVRTDAESGNHSRYAGGTDQLYNHDNSVDDPHTGPDGVCASITIPQDPDVDVVKTGPTTVTVGTSYSYDLTASNTGIVPADDVTITDVIPSNVDFVSASAPCTYDTGTRTVSCDVGTLDIDGSASVTITVTPLTPGVDIVNTATVTPDDITPEDNTSTWTITGPNVLPASAEKTPTVTPAAIVAAPTFTG